MEIGMNMKHERATWPIRAHKSETASDTEDKRDQGVVASHGEGKYDRRAATVTSSVHRLAQETKKRKSHGTPGKNPANESVDDPPVSLVHQALPQLVVVAEGRQVQTGRGCYGTFVRHRKRVRNRHLFRW